MTGFMVGMTECKVSSAAGGTLPVLIDSWVPSALHCVMDGDGKMYNTTQAPPDSKLTGVLLGSTTC
jgi:hypothetical protein